ncbi:S8 family serine peptidase [Glycomyces arizonensis]|uniref:S8 family serine peptidase n=1 Tax=Glycomyces arizonensis TaxID=256035 RepID=UPI00040D5A5C|nr:S8 family serine peptidase [Glycomyces arizonensis]
MTQSQRWRQTLAIASTGVLVSAFAGSAAWAAPESDVDALIDQKVDADLLAAIDAEGEAELWVRFEGAPDYHPAFSADAKTDKGTAAVEAAREFAEESQADVAAALDDAGADYESFWASSTIKVTGDADLLADIVAFDEVAEVVEAPDYKLIEPVAMEVEPETTEWGLDNINVPDVWDMGFDGSGVVIASIDTGVDYTHPTLVDHYRGNNGDGTFTHDYNFYDIQGVCDSDAPCDYDGHGTHTMGTMVGDDGEGNQIGVAPGAEWIAVNACCPDAETLLAAGEWIAAPTDSEGNDPDPSKAPDIVNNSWGTTDSIDDPFYEDVIALWHAAGIIPVFSLGNNGEFGCESAGSPGLYPNVIGVGAYDVDNVIADFSARGPGRDGQVKPDLAAPGVNVRSAYPGGGYAYGDGTSMAAPHVAGTIALMLSAAPALEGDFDAVYEALTSTAHATADDQCGGTEELNNVYGHGRLDALEAVLASPIGDTGAVEGTVTDAEGTPIEDATVAFTGEFSRSATTGADGAYSVPRLPVGTYEVTVSKFGYEDATGSVTVTVDATTAFDATLTAVPSTTVTGTVVDGSGHGWPLAATVSTTGGEVSTVTDPLTGEFSITLPEGEWELAVEADYPGYQDVTVGVVSAADTLIEVPIAEGCIAPGYALGPIGTGFETEAAPAGWSVVNRGVEPWRFDDFGDEGNRTPGSGGFATANSDAQGSGSKLMDTDLISPVFDLSSVDDPTLTFDTDYYQGSYDTEADVAVSTDGGRTWAEAWASDGSARDTSISVDLSEWADATEARVKFHYTDNEDWAWWWQIDNVLVGDAAECAPVAGGLVRGTVADMATGDPLEGARVTHLGSGYSGTADADGAYWTFAAGSGESAFEAVVDDFGSAVETVEIVPDGVTTADFEVGTPEISVSSTALNSYVQQGSSWTHKLKITNSGTADGIVSFDVGDGGFSIMGYGNPSDTSWLTVEADSVTVPAGETVTVNVKTTATEEFGVDQPGTYTATLSLNVVSPYEKPVIDVSMLVVPKNEQGKLVGTVESADCDGGETLLESVQVQIREYGGETLHLLTDEEGGYSYWLDDGTYTVIVSKDGYAADFDMVEVEGGTTNELPFTLEELNC